ncbi:hypothetical protein IQ276_030775 [Desmonostoc muscorum LEGE 12446]|uniref:Uncharacterized protein n=1 Tax=Desmonostoc muscorum LEGE 12446 TaxID=1828758 RepID=A0A8J7D0K6_DESMC|nr:hypothetical protein [Desmonostoc muscorum]MCF2150731.1 hypothetical protein [Desmonostoc muscorum LEGE 12446]
MKTHVKIALVFATITVGTFFHIAQVRAGIVQGSGNRLLCRGETSCTALKQVCNDVGGRYVEGNGGTGQCTLPPAP